jgi:hypothetical protein
MGGESVTREEFMASTSPDQIGALWVRCNGGRWELYRGGVSRHDAYAIGTGLRNDARRNGDDVEPSFEPVGYDPNVGRLVLPVKEAA